jgi:small subunit ribosomal protein S22
MIIFLHLKECLKTKKYLLVLNKACNIYEPDDPEFIRITHRTYEYINEMKDYETLFSTRFFGPMVFYLTWFKKLDNILAYTINKANLEDSAHMIKLFLILHGQEAKTAQLINEQTNVEKLIEVFLNLNLN